MRYSITSSFKNLSAKWEKLIFHCEEWNFEPTANSAHTTELSVLGKALNTYIDYLMYYLCRHVKRKHFNNDFMKNN